MSWTPCPRSRKSNTPTARASRRAGAWTIKLSGQRRRNRGLLLACLALSLPLSIALGIGSGAVSLNAREIIGGLYSVVSGNGDSQAALIVGQIRLPRVLLASLMGAILGMSGAAMQGLFRNPLADPSLIGVTAGASLGAALVIVLGGELLQGYTALTAVSVGAFAGGAVAVVFVYRLATSASGTSVATMLLAGIAITALAGALGSLLEFHAD
ncbi:MAG: iron chelate uptake ABC transporter family permease subunit, partial [Halieaceae bacterium]|nr:iron chelate uptake ABC transporter family permease subunit [Halieaceae bacterium]